MSDLQHTCKCERRYLLIIIGDFGELALEEIDVGFEAIPWPHFDGDEVMTTPLGFLTSDIFCEEGLDDLLEVVKRVRR